MGFGFVYVRFTDYKHLASVFAVHVEADYVPSVVRVLFRQVVGQFAPSLAGSGVYCAECFGFGASLCGMDLYHGVGRGIADVGQYFQSHFAASFGGEFGKLHAYPLPSLPISITRHISA